MKIFCRFKFWIVLAVAPGFLLALDQPILNPAQVTAPRFKRIALTFDDGPRPEYTEKLMAILEQTNARGTFFVVGKQAEKYPNLILELVAKGHEVANHSWSHPSVRKLNEESLKFELDKTRIFLRGLTGKDTSFFRAPGGTIGYLRNELVVPKGYRMVLWTVHTLDHEKPSPELIRQRVLEGARDGAVVLFHTGVESTLRALPGLIDTLRSEGFVFVTVSQLLGENAQVLALAQPSLR